MSQQQQNQSSHGQGQQAQPPNQDNMAGAGGVAPPQAGQQGLAPPQQTQNPPPNQNPTPTIQWGTLGPPTNAIEDTPRLIPDKVKAIAEFNSLPSKTPPYRDIPSVILTHLSIPNFAGPEPDWMSFLVYYMRPTYPPMQANSGVGNLGDLFMLMSRILLPGAIMENRALMLELFTMNPHFNPFNRARYDGFDATPHGQQNPANFVIIPPPVDNYRPNLNLNTVYPMPPRSILPGQPTPDGNRFLTWLQTLPAPLIPGTVVPVQIRHNTSQMDVYLTIPETQIRTLSLGDLLRRTTRVFQMWWWVSFANLRTRHYRDRNDWVGFRLNEM